MQLEHSGRSASRIARFWLSMRHLTLPLSLQLFNPPKNTSLPCLGRWFHNYDLVAARPRSTTRRHALFDLALTLFRAPDLGDQSNTKRYQSTGARISRKSNACSVLSVLCLPAVRTLYVEWEL